MVTTFSRLVKAAEVGDDSTTLEEADATVRANLSAMAAPDDDEQRYADDVQVSTATFDNGDVLVTGTLEREPVADYLREDFDPEQDARDNPLTVPSHFDEPSDPARDLGQPDAERVTQR